MPKSRGIGKGAHLRRFGYVGTCLVPDCTNVQSAKGVCNKHYLKTYVRPKGTVCRNELAKEVAAITNMTVRQSRSILSLIPKLITKALKDGEDVYIRGFGTFRSHTNSKYVYGNHYYFTPARELLFIINQGE